MIVLALLFFILMLQWIFYPIYVNFLLLKLWSNRKQTYSYNENNCQRSYCVNETFVTKITSKQMSEYAGCRYISVHLLEKNERNFLKKLFKVYWKSWLLETKRARNKQKLSLIPSTFLSSANVFFEKIDFWPLRSVIGPSNRPCAQKQFKRPESKYGLCCKCKILKTYIFFAYAFQTKFY